VEVEIRGEKGRGELTIDGEEENFVLHSNSELSIIEYDRIEERVG
jgi:hypothetical protein